MHFRFIVTLLSFSILMSPFSTAVGARTPKGLHTNSSVINILILHSYHPGYPWTDQIMLGMQQILSKHERGVNTYVEYLDTKRHPDREYFTDVLSKALRYKLNTRSFDLIMVSDNEALDFVLNHREDLFAAVPVVFSGINNYTPALLRGDTNMTGVVEKNIYKEVLDIALDLFPATTNIVVISGLQEPCDYVNYESFIESSVRASHQVQFDFWVDLPANQIATRLMRLPSNSLVFINSEISGCSGHVLSFEEKTRMIASAARIPVFATRDVYLNRGIVGGPLLSAKQHGKISARMALQILAGSKAGEMPVVAPALDPPVFDYLVLRKFNIPANTLPQPHVLINAPPSFYRISKLQATMASVAFAGSLAFSLALTTNIWRRKKAEGALRANEQQYRELSRQFEVILNGISHGLTLVDREMRVVWSNQGRSNYFNNALSSVPGEHCCKLLYNRKTLCENCPAIESFKTGQMAEATINIPDGRMMDVKSFPLKNNDQQTTHAIMLAIDVTEKHRFQQQAIIAGRLASLGELAAGVAHEINNPNGLILLNIDLLRKVCHDTTPILDNHFHQHGDFLLSGIPYSEMVRELPHIFNETIDSAKRIRRIVEDVKEFTRAESPDMEELIDINVAAQSAERLIKSSIQASKIIFSFEENLPRTLANQQRIEQVIVNLLTNACQALNGEKQRVFVKTWYREANNTVVLQVRDEGCGISAEHLNKINEPFFTTKRDNGGTGLGLSISNRIINDHHGSLNFISKPGQGTTAILSLPAHLEEHEFEQL